MAAELELAAWNTYATKLWSTFVEPPWNYSINHGLVQLDVMDTITTFPVRQGPQQKH
jgi:hypothetical protein